MLCLTFSGWKNMLTPQWFKFSIHGHTVKIIITLSGLFKESANYNECKKKSSVTLGLALFTKTFLACSQPASRLWLWDIASGYLSLMTHFTCMQTQRWTTWHWLWDCILPFYTLCQNYTFDSWRFLNLEIFSLLSPNLTNNNYRVPWIPQRKTWTPEGVDKLVTHIVHEMTMKGHITTTTIE